MSFPLLFLPCQMWLGVLFNVILCMHLWFEISFKKKSQIWQRQFEWHAVSLAPRELAVVSFRTFKYVSAWTEWEHFCMFLRRQPLLAASQYSVVHDSCPSSLSSPNLTFDRALCCRATVGAAQDVGEWRALACNVLVIIWLSKVACHWAPSRFETYVQQSILLNFQDLSTGTIECA